MPNTYHHWRLITKVFIIANALVWALLMAFVPNSLTYVVAHLHHAGIIPTAVLIVGIGILTADLFLSDHMVHGQRKWFGLRFMPLAYMVMGGGYLIFAYMCTYVNGAGILMFNALIQATMAGWVAFLTKKDLHDL